MFSSSSVSRTDVSTPVRRETSVTHAPAGEVTGGPLASTEDRSRGSTAFDATPPAGGTDWGRGGVSGGGAQTESTKESTGTRRTVEETPRGPTLRGFLCVRSGCAPVDTKVPGADRLGSRPRGPWTPNLPTAWAPTDVWVQSPRGEHT